MKSVSYLISGMVFGLTLVSCNSNDNPVSPNLTPAQTAAVMHEVGSAASQGATPDIRRPKDLATSEQSGQSGTTSVTKTVSCSAGGTATVTGSATTTDSGNTNPETITSNPITFTITMTNCQSMGSDGVLYSINSTGFQTTGSNTMVIDENPDSTFSFSDSGSFTISGNFSVIGSSSGSSSGSTNISCDVNVNEVFSGTDNNNQSSVTGNVSGTLCGNSVNMTI